jgi:phage FluMu protein Com
MASFRCEHCRQKIAARDAHAGRRVRCPRCKQSVRVPVLEAAAQVPPAPVEVAKLTPAKLEPEVIAPVAIPEPAPVFTPPLPQDFSSIFSAPLDALFEGGAPDYGPEEQTQVLRPVYPAEERPHPAPAIDASYLDLGDIGPIPEPPPAPVVVEPAEIIDAPGPMRPGLNSVNEVADLLRGLDNPSQRARLAASSAAADAEVRRQVLAISRPVRVLGWMSVLVGLGSIALSCFPAWARFAVPAGAGGLLLAMSGLAVAVGRRAGIGLPAGGAFASVAGVAVALLWGFGFLPWRDQGGAHARLNAAPVTLIASTQPSRQAAVAGDYVPASSPLIVNRLQVRVASAMVLRPAVYSGDIRSLHTADDQRLQITLELKNLANTRTAYLPWRRNSEDNEFVQLTGPKGAILPFDELAVSDPEKPVVLAAAALPGPIYIDRVPVYDVLLFDPPASVAGDFLLDLPGRNIGQPAVTLHIRIPGSMVRVQGK